MSKLLVERLGILWRGKLSIHPVPPGERRSAKDVMVNSGNQLLNKVGRKARVLSKTPEEPEASLLRQNLYRGLIGHSVNKAAPKISALAKRPSIHNSHKRFCRLEQCNVRMKRGANIAQTCVNNTTI